MRPGDEAVLWQVPVKGKALACTTLIHPQGAVGGCLLVEER
jgi:hypothetical protein